MSKNPIRKDKTCLNCNHVVENRFCPNCGQENIETRKTFHHLFFHFFEDLTHYENAFWKTIKNLVLRPGSLTREYLSGKRMSYLAPVRLYIFISFVTFFVITILPDEDKKIPTVTHKKNQGYQYAWKDIKAAEDSIAKYQNSGTKKDNNRISFGSGQSFASVRELDSVQQFGKPEDRFSSFGYWFARKAVLVTEHNTTEELWNKFTESFSHNLPKVLFIYMPMFAFVLWLFQSKKRWYYFDHGIFTLHYFSFLLLGLLVMSLFGALMSLFDNAFASTLDAIVSFILFGYMFYFFFPAHHRFYGETRGITILKGLSMLFINMILAGIIMTVFILYTFINIH
jgi:hypothetical protein